MTNLTTAQKTPTDIEVDIRGREVRLAWQDGHHSTFDFNTLRKICPCATCNDQRKNADPLRILKPDQIVTKAELQPDHPVEMVGNYALQFVWADGHQTGIYTFEFLRQHSHQAS